MKAFDKNILLIEIWSNLHFHLWISTSDGGCFVLLLEILVIFIYQLNVLSCFSKKLLAICRNNKNCLCKKKYIIVIK